MRGGPPRSPWATLNNSTFPDLGLLTGSGGYPMGDLFCGPGGFATGFEWAGFSSRVAIDLHPPSLQTYAAMHPSATVIESDIREIDTEAVSEAFNGETQR